MRALVLLHRWLGIVFCFPFAIWFGSGIVMHFVSFPDLTEVERVAGLLWIDPARVLHAPAAAEAASGIGDVRRVRLLERSDGPVYVVSGPSHTRALRAVDLADAGIRGGESSWSIAVQHARQRGLNASNAAFAELVRYDQWTAAERFDAHRPLYRISLNDDVGTELYVSSTTGEVVLDTTRRERCWNYIGSVAHWIYPTILRSHPVAWSLLVWWLSLLALISATIGVAIGVLRIKIHRSRLSSRYRGLQAWHHWSGLISAPFLLTWILSGWLSMDHGQLFSSGQPSAAERATIAGPHDWDALPRDELERISVPGKEVEWFAFGGRIYGRERTGLNQQRVWHTDEARAENRSFLRSEEVALATSKLARDCNTPYVIGSRDGYLYASEVSSSPVFRIVCGNDWFHIDGATGAVLDNSMGPGALTDGSTAVFTR
jgi:PepSY-associated TM region